MIFFETLHQGSSLKEVENFRKKILGHTEDFRTFLTLPDIQNIQQKINFSSDGLHQLILDIFKL